ncbi:MAG TPA: DNA double-strand break repair nuclease NurA [Verrucomicrobiota bacterium]|nr:DNA double-strand break repair nuclease NurA [Verrucomicrobiota bacterium]HNU52001.1 DNA double-strand break repair nuclease NurA [Verrucomicrobiota bacterium]
MQLSAERLERLQRSLGLALDQEWPQLTAAQKRLARLRPTSIAARPASSTPLLVVATVATDGGENKLNLDPIRVQVVRVADSLGEIYFEDFIAGSLAPEEILQFFSESNEKLHRFLAYLQLEPDQLLPRSDFQRSQLLSMLRELMEWAALLKLASQPPAKLLIRDGLLRSVLLTDLVFHRLRVKFEALTAKHGHLLVGVAKRSRVLSYLSVALGLTESFGGGDPAYLAVPEELEREAAPSQYRWIGSRAMGLLHIARLDRGESVPLMPVDIAEWQGNRVAEAMLLLQESARASFPLRGYPQALVQAHEHARLGGLEIEMLETLLLQQVARRDPAVGQTARQLMLLGRQLSEGIEDHEHDGG